MKTALLVCLAALAAGAQLSHAQMTITGPAVYKAGATISLTVSCTGCTGKNIAAVQVDVPPAGLSNLSCAAASSLTAASKTATCALVGTTAVYRAIGAGLNQNVITDGPLFTITGTVPASPSATLSFLGQNIIASDAGGSTLAPPIVAGPAFAMTLLSPCDINEDGKVDTNDFGLALSQALGIAPAANQQIADLIGTGSVTVEDLVRIAVATTGAACRTGK